MEGVPADPAERSPEDQARWLLAQLLSWHRREDKATWWQFFRLLALSSSQLIEGDRPDRGTRAGRAADGARREGEAGLALSVPRPGIQGLGPRCGL